MCQLLARPMSVWIKVGAQSWSQVGEGHPWSMVRATGVCVSWCQALMGWVCVRGLGAIYWNQNGSIGPWTVVPATRASWALTSHPGGSGVFYSQPCCETGVCSQASSWGYPCEWGECRALHRQLEQGHRSQPMCLVLTPRRGQVYFPTCCAWVSASKL